MDVGIDTLNLDRIKDLKSFSIRVLSSEELVVFEKISNEQRRLEYAAARFSLKEAFVKASGIKELSFKDITILNDENGKPYLKYQDYQTLVSISHERTHVVTICIVI